MTLDEAIKHAKKVARQNEEDAIVYSNCKNHKKNLYEIGLAENAEEKCCKCAEEHRQLAEWLKELKRLRDQTRWIPVSEQSPKKYGNYWCTFGGTNIAGIDYYTTESDAKEIFDYKYAGWRSQNVVAWMPLPKPYKAESEEI